MTAGQPLPAVLQALSDELADLHQEALTLQDVLPETSDLRAMIGLQRLDALTQALDALAAYTARLGDAVAADAPLDPDRPAQAVPLVALAMRLALRKTAAPAAAPTAGELDLF